MRSYLWGLPCDHFTVAHRAIFTSTCDIADGRGEFCVYWHAARALLTWRQACFAAINAEVSLGNHLIQLQPDSSPDTSFHDTLLQAILVAIRSDADVQAGAQQVQREVLPQSGAGRRGGSALLQAAGDSAV